MSTLLSTVGSGSGSSLPLPVLVLAGVSTIVATVVSFTSIFLHIRNYRKPVLQRMVVRIMVMVPLYAIASLISLFSMEAAFFIDAVRDIYEAFVIYCFFDLLIAYLGGERSLLSTLHGRPPKYPVFPGNLLWPEVDVSDPYTFLFLKRGILQYVQVKPILALVTIILKAVGKYNEGDLRANSGYLYVSIVYNTSICMALYCLAIFWMCVNDDLKPFRPVPKFLCVKGILFFSFWQGILISILVAAAVITKLGPYTDSEHISLALTDLLVCIEMPFFAIAHQYAFSTVDFVEPHAKYVARMRMGFAFRDAFGIKDVIEDSKATLRGEGMDYREFEPSEGFMHQGAGRDRRIRAGLRYSQGGKRKYWLPQPATSSLPPGNVERRVNRAIERVTGRPDRGDEVYAPLLADEEDAVVHIAPDLRSPDEEENIFSIRDPADAGFELPFGDPDPADDELFTESKKYLFGDYNYPVIDVSSEYARMRVWDEEERILRNERNVYFSHLGSSRAANTPKQGYGATDIAPRLRHDSQTSISSKGKGKIVPASNGAVIDKEQDRHGDTIGQEVRLGWTKLGGGGAPTTPRIRTLSSQGKGASSHPSSSLPSPASGSPRGRPSPSPRREDDHPVLPPDAVDLVVEDHHAARDDAAHGRERRRSSPAGPALRKVYRRGYIVDTPSGAGKKKGEVEVATEGAVSFAVGDDDGGDDVDAITQTEIGAVEDMTVTRETTPPAHARIVVDQYDVNDENPWA